MTRQELAEGLAKAELMLKNNQYFVLHIAHKKYAYSEGSNYYEVVYSDLGDIFYIYEKHSVIATITTDSLNKVYLFFLDKEIDDLKIFV